MDIIRIFYSPKKAVQNILIKNQFPWIVFLLTLLYPNISTVMNFNATKQLALNQLQAQFATTGVDISSAALTSMVNTAMYVTLVTTIIMTLLQWLAFAALLNFIVGFYDSEQSFKSIFAMVGYANLIQGLYILVTAILFHSGFENIDFSLLMLIHVSPTSNPILVGLLQNISLFRIWKYIVIGIGVSYCVEERLNAIPVMIMMFAISTCVTVAPMIFLPK